MDGLMKGSGEHHQSIQPKQTRSLSNKSDGDSIGQDDILSHKGALTLTPGGMRIDRELGAVCSECAQACPAAALEVIGRRWTPDELLNELVKDQVFYETSGRARCVGASIRRGRAGLPRSIRRGTSRLLGALDGASQSEACWIISGAAVFRRLAWI